MLVLLYLEYVFCTLPVYEEHRGYNNFPASYVLARSSAAFSFIACPGPSLPAEPFPPKTISNSTQNQPNPNQNQTNPNQTQNTWLRSSPRSSPLARSRTHAPPPPSDQNQRGEGADGLSVLPLDRPAGLRDLLRHRLGVHPRHD